MRVTREENKEGTGRRHRRQDEAEETGVKVRRRQGRRQIMGKEEDVEGPERGSKAGE